MSKKLWILFLLPSMAGLAQCPEYINYPLKNAKVFMSLAEQRLGIIFTDSSISSSRERMTYNNAPGDHIVKLTARRDTLLTLYFEAPNAFMKTFTDWFEATFADCATETDGNKMVFEDCVVIIEPKGERRKVFTISPK